LDRDGDGGGSPRWLAYRGAERVDRSVGE
jgi:hypothetical protein